MTMDYEINHEFDNFLKDFSNGIKDCTLYFDEDWYEDEYSYNDIHEAQGILFEKIITFLHNHQSKDYVVGGDYCIRVMTIKEANKRGLRINQYMIM